MDAAAGMPHRNNGTRLDKGFRTPADPGCPMQPTTKRDIFRNRFWISDCVPHLNGCCRRHATPKQLDPPGQRFLHTCRSGMSHATTTKRHIFRNRFWISDRVPHLNGCCRRHATQKQLDPPGQRFSHTCREVPGNQHQITTESEIGSGFQIAFPI